MNKIVLKDLVDKPSREFILLCANGKVGKSYRVLELCRYLQGQNLGAIVIDTESSPNSNVLDGFKKLWVKQFPDVENLHYYPCDTAATVVEAFNASLPGLNNGEWLVMESAARYWEYCQDAASMLIAGVTKDEYISTKYIPALAGKRVNPTPESDKYWQIAKDYYFRQFFDVIQHSTFNTFVTTTLYRESNRNPKAEQATAVLKDESGLPIVPDGAPNLGGYPDTLLKLARSGSNGWELTVYGDRGKPLLSFATFEITEQLYPELLDWRKNG